jgi:Uma2 family endonuclease
MSAALKFVPHYTVDDYALWKGDWELWEGIAIAMSPSPFGRHQRVLFSLAAELRAELLRTACQATSLGELDWVVAEDTVVRPDVMVVCGEPPERHVHAAPSLIGEVLSDATRQNDLTYKRQLYQREKVDVYLIIDPEAETIELDHRQEDGSYKNELVAGELQIRLCKACDIRIETAAIFRR